MKGNRIISIPLDDIVHAVNLRTYYKGENVKRKDIDADLTQSSTDDREEILQFVETAANKVAGLIYTKMPDTQLAITKEDIIYTFLDVVKPNTRKFMERAVKDYIVNWCLYQWYQDNYPELSKPYLDDMPFYEAEVIRQTNLIRPIVRRKYVWF